jgi:2-polyprenyl-3-methyl-5-hydroxy-6-metoxy-1,4-benzoquinol methylase
MVLNEHDIRPTRLAEGQQKYIRADRERLLSFREKFVDVPCPACDSNQYSVAFEKNGMHYVSCSHCHTLYVNPRPNSEILGFCYANSEVYAFWNKYIYPQSENTRREQIVRPRAIKVAELCKNAGITRGTLVEVGAGFGIFCEEIRRIGPFDRVIAIEPAVDLAKTCKDKGIEVINDSIEKVPFPPGSVDVIVSFEVIEHLFSPKKFIETCTGILKPGGLLVLTCPNGDGFEILALKERADTIDHEHLNYFNPSSIASLIEHHGFEILDLSTPGVLDADIVHNKIMDGTLDVSSNPFFTSVFIDHWEQTGQNFQRFLSDNRLSAHMMVIARKVP